MRSVLKELEQVERHKSYQILSQVVDFEMVVRSPVNFRYLKSEHFFVTDRLEILKRE